MTSGLPSLPVPAFVTYFSSVCIFHPYIPTVSRGPGPSVHASTVPADAEPAEDSLLLFCRSCFPAKQNRSPSSVRLSLTVADSSENGGEKPLKCQHFIHPCPPGDRDGRLHSPPLRLLVHIHPQVPSPLPSASIPFRRPILESERTHWKFALKV